MASAVGDDDFGGEVIPKAIGSLDVYGFTFEGYDLVVYGATLPLLMREWHISAAFAGLIATANNMPITSPCTHRTPHFLVLFIILAIPFWL